MANSGWNTSGIEVPTELVDFVENVSDSFDPIVSILESIASILEGASEFVEDAEGIMDSFIKNTLSLVAELIQGYLDSGISLAVHSNLVWDVDWQYSPPSDEEASRSTDGSASTRKKRNFTEDGDLPWTATGLNGWLLDIASSCNNPANPNAPRSDGGASVFCIILVMGFADVSAFGEAYTSLKRCAELLGWQDIVTPTQDAWEALSSKAGQSWIRAQDAWDLIGVQPSPSESESENNNQTFSEYLDVAVDDLFVNRGTPIWTTASVSRIFPATDTVFSYIDELSKFLQDATDGSLLTETLNTISQKIIEITKVIERIQKAIDALALLISTLGDLIGYISIQVPSGGVSAAISEAMQAENFPDYGENGVVLGTVALSSTESGAEQVRKFMELLGDTSGQFSALADQYESNVDSATANIQTSSGTFSIIWS